MTDVAKRTGLSVKTVSNVLSEGMDGMTAQQVQDVPMDLSHRLAPGEAVSPLRLNGMGGMLARVKRQVRHKAAL